MPTNRRVEQSRSKKAGVVFAPQLEIRADKKKARAGLVFHVLPLIGVIAVWPTLY
jgi:hypothetical protein